MIAFGALLLMLMSGQAADVKGKWNGTLSGQRPDGTSFEDPALLVLDQKDATVTGTVGNDEADQHPITSGKIEGNKVVLLATHTRNGRRYRLELTVEADVMKGTVTSGDIQMQLVVKRRKQ